MYFPSKKDIWMTMTIWLLILILIVPPIFFPDFGVYLLPDMLDTRLTRLAITFVPALLFLWIWLKTGYTITDSVIQIECGPFKKTIDIKEINRVRTVKHPFTAPALSMDRIEIYYGKAEIVTISPENKEEFIRQLLKRNPNIQTDRPFSRG